MRVAIVVARFNDFVTDRLLVGAQAALRDAGIAESDVEVMSKCCACPEPSKCRWRRSELPKAAGSTLSFASAA
jgi:hypothetical protein